MSEYITFIVLAVVIFIGLSIAFIRVRAYNLKEKLHQQLSNHFGLRGSYINEKKFKLFGHNRDYKLVIESASIPSGGSSSKLGNSIKMSIPMVNPTRKCLRIFKEGSGNPALEGVVPMDKLLEVKHDMGSWLKIHTNDLVFSSMILSENVRISLSGSLKNLNHSLIIYIQDEELACIVPGILTKKSQLEDFYKLVDVLADIKDELN